MNFSRLRTETIQQVAAIFAVVATGMTTFAEDNTSLIFNDGMATNVGSLLIIGDTGTNNTMVISNGSMVGAWTGIVGNAESANYNTVLITDPGSVWSNRNIDFYLGREGSYNQLVISNGGSLVAWWNDAGRSRIGMSTNSTGNSVLVTGSGSLWNARGSIRLGAGSSNLLVIADGGEVRTTSGVSIGDDFTGHPNIPGGNRLVVTGSNSVLNVGTGGSQQLTVGNLSGNNEFILTNGATANVGILFVGLVNNLSSSNLALITGAGSVLTVNNSITFQRRANVLRIENEAVVTVRSNVTLTDNTSLRQDNMVDVTGGFLFVTNEGSSATIDVIRGTNRIDGGTVTVDNLILTNSTRSVLTFHSGTLNTGNTTISNDVVTMVGNGIDSATLNLVGGTHSFVDGLSISANATLKGTGTVEGDTTVLGTLAPGNSPGILSAENLTLLSNATYAVDIDGTTVGTDYDQVNVTGFVNLSNSLLSITLGYTPTMGDSFTIINNDASDGVFGEFAGLAQASEFTLGGGEFKILYNGGTGNDVLLIAVPEPSSLALLMAAAFGLASSRRGKKAMPEVR